MRPSHAFIAGGPINRVSFLSTFVAAFFSFAVVFFVIRYFSFPFLGFYTLPTPLMRFQSLISGALSDIWMSVWMALLSCLLGALISRRTFTLVTFYIGIGMSSLFSLHIPYVEFFGKLISISHLSYLTDIYFLASSVNSAFDYRLFVTTLLFIISFLIFHAIAAHLITQKQRSRAYVGWATFSLIFIAGFCQVAKVNLNTRKFPWKTPTILKLNFVESLVTSSANPIISAPFSQEEEAFIRDNFDTNASGFLQLLEKRPVSAETTEALQLKSEISSRLSNNKPLFIFVVLLESFRAEESRFFTPENKVSYTPFLDTLAESSLAFTRAFTSGSVTRSGQEASFCGLLTGEYTSAMRTLMSLAPRCLPRILNDEFPNRSYSGWWHGGDYNFDSQGAFWKRQGVNRVLSHHDIEKSAPHTFWGYSDYFLVERSLNEIAKVPEEKNVQSHMILSVTNHPDWGLPKDAEENIVALKNTTSSPTQPTIRYTDAALERFVKRLKESTCLACGGKTMWENSLVFVMNDHGTLMASERKPKGYTWDLTDEDDLLAADVISRGGLVLSGGLINKFYPEGRKIDRFVSQADIFATATDLLSVHASTAADTLLGSQRRWPVIVDLGDRIFLPELGKIASRKKMLDGKLDGNKKMDLAKVFFKGYQKLLAAGDAGR